MKYDRNKAIGLNNSGSLKNTEGKFWEAIDLFTSAYEADPTFLETINNRGYANLNACRIEDALSDFEIVLKKIPNDVQALIGRTNAFIQLGQYVDAESNLKYALSLDPTNADAHGQRGILHERQNNYIAAFKDYDRAIEINPNNDGMAYYNRGLARLRQRQLKKAIKDFSAALDRNPSLVEALNNRGSAYAMRGKMEKANADFIKATEVSPWHAKAYFNLGLLSAQKGEDKAALSYLEKASNLGHQKARDLAEDIRQSSGK